MAIPHASSGQVVDLDVLDAEASETCAVVKDGDIEIMWLVLPGGKQIPSHAVSTSMTLQCVRGRVEVLVDGITKVLAADQVMYIASGLPHGFHALEESRILVTLVLPASRTD
ncbi:cupin domain-containing protein [Variovorax sp. J22R24]|uniref:cupin domain-containing protein n=1 Tax=Variovorax gracilis TaxID=3053502 RepID=UPI002577D9B3|nr:cupin domain-containing protein [Variovorax sp. J22R24]MDM0108858.1 cupin domain-containing protein [Variovorax sp. J22R24]